MCPRDESLLSRNDTLRQLFINRTDFSRPLSAPIGSSDEYFMSRVLMPLDSTEQVFCLGRFTFEMESYIVRVHRTECDKGGDDQRGIRPGIANHALRIRICIWLTGQVDSYSLSHFERV